MDRLDALLASLGLEPGDRDLIAQALTHASWVHEHPDAGGGHNERLEFLGDAVVSLAITEALYARHPGDDEGVLSTRRAAIVSTTGLATLAAQLDLGEALSLGEGEDLRGGRHRPSLLASAFEAVAGAVFLSRGWTAARDWVLDVAAAELAATRPAADLKSPKSRLQEYTQRRSGDRPEYRLVDTAGPEHEKRFTIDVFVDGRRVGAGVGSSRRIAETNAAAEALAVLGPAADAGDDGESTVGGEGSSGARPSGSRPSGPRGEPR